MIRECIWSSNGRALDALETAAKRERCGSRHAADRDRSRVLFVSSAVLGDVAERGDVFADLGYPLPVDGVDHCAAGLSRDDDLGPAEHRQMRTHEMARNAHRIR